MHALTLLLITLFFGGLAAHIPLAALAAILIMVAYHMSEWRTVRSELKSGPRADALVLMATLLLMGVIDLPGLGERVVGWRGWVRAGFLFIKRLAEVTHVTVVGLEVDDADVASEDAPRVPRGAAVYEINGPFFFGAAEKFKETLGTIDNPPSLLIISLRNVPVIDSTGLHAFEDMVERFRGDGTLVLLTELRAQPRDALRYPRAGGPGAAAAPS